MSSKGGSSQSQRAVETGGGKGKEKILKKGTSFRADLFTTLDPKIRWSWATEILLIDGF